MSRPHNVNCIVTLSFDDGYAETIQSVGRILEKLDFKATFNIIVGLVEDSLKEYRSASWDDLRSLVAAGNEIASHGMFHLPLASGIKSKARKFLRLFSNQPVRALSLSKYLSINPAYTVKNIGITHELKSSKRIIEENIPNYKCVSFAYPSGDYDKKLKILVKDSGYLSARSTKVGYNNPTNLDPYALKANMWDCTTRVKEANKWVDVACRRRAWLIECLHLVSNNNRKKYPHFTHVDNLKKHLNYLTNRNVWVTTQKDAIESILNSPKIG